MTTASNKLWLGAGVFAVAAVTLLSPVAASADPAADPGNSSDGVGNSAGTPTPTRPSRGAVSRAQAAANADNAPAAGRAGNGRVAVGAEATGSNPLFQNPLWWFGTPNPAPPPPAYTTTFQPLANLPGWSQGYYGWYRNTNFEACVLGLGHTITNSVGPYGTATNSVSTGGC